MKVGVILYKDTIENMNKSFIEKILYSKINPFPYLISSIMAGIFLALSGFAAITVGNMCSNSFIPEKIAMGMIFSTALSLVIMAGGDLFTGSNLYSGFLLFRNDNRRKVKMIIEFSILCWFGNFIGSWIMILLYNLSGLCFGELLDYFVNVSTIKVNLSITEMIIRGILCNICVCLAVWCCKRMSSESGKLMMIFWCILVFMVCGFEHSIANMSIIGIGVLNGYIHIDDYINNLIFVTIGNVIGGMLFVALPYHCIKNNR